MTPTQESKNRQFTLEGLLEDVTEENLHEELDTEPAVGQEAWQSDAGRRTQGANTRMTITLELPSDIESELREEAQKADLDPDAYILNALRKHLHQTQPPHLSEAESELLQQINLGLSQKEWQRYHGLIAKRRAETLNTEEQEELITLSDRVEEANARRMEALVKLARIRQTSLEAVMEDLGIETPSYV